MVCFLTSSGVAMLAAAIIANSILEDQSVVHLPVVIAGGIVLMFAGAYHDYNMWVQELSVLDRYEKLSGPTR